MTDQIVELQSLQDPVPGVAEREQVDTEGENAKGESTVPASRPGLQFWG